MQRITDQKNFERMLVPSRFEQLGEITQGRAFGFTMLTMFLADQVFGAAMDCCYKAEETSLYRHELKRIAKLVGKEAERLNRLIDHRLGHKRSAFMAEFDMNMEAHTRKHIDIFRYQVSQVLLDTGLSGEANEVYSHAIVADTLCQVLNATIKQFEILICTPNGLVNTLEEYSGKALKRLVRRLIACLPSPERGVDMNDMKPIRDAFMCFIYGFLDVDKLNKAVADADAAVNR